MLCSSWRILSSRLMVRRFLRFRGERVRGIHMFPGIHHNRKMNLNFEIIERKIESSTLRSVNFILY